MKIMNFNVAMLYNNDFEEIIRGNMLLITSESTISVQINVYIRQRDFYKKLIKQLNAVSVPNTAFQLQ